MDHRGIHADIARKLLYAKVSYGAANRTKRVGNDHDELRNKLVNEGIICNRQDLDLLYDPPDQYDKALTRQQNLVLLNAIGVLVDRIRYVAKETEIPENEQMFSSCGGAFRSF